jgi:hypothetical protein
VCWAWAFLSIIILYGSGSFHQQAKKVRKPLIFVTFFGLLSMKTDVNVPSKSIKQNNLRIKHIFVGILSANDKNCKVRIRQSVVRIDSSLYILVPMSAHNFATAPIDHRTFQTASSQNEIKVLH